MLQKLILCFFGLLLLAIPAIAQKQKFERETLFGPATFIDAPVSGEGWRPGFGIGLLRRVSKRSGFETGLYFRNYPEFISVSTNNRTFEAVIHERNLMIPLMYRFQNKWLHFSFGPTVDFYMGWKQVSGTDISVDTYERSPAIDLGIMTKIGVPITVSDKIKILPEVRFNPAFVFYRVYGGVGVTVWYRN
jgi:hypothetical protein